MSQLLAFIISLIEALLGGLAAGRRAELAQLEAMAAGLEGGSFVDGVVQGRLGGRAVRVRWERRGQKKHHHTVTSVTLEVPNPAAAFRIDEVGVLDHLGRWLGLSKDELGSPDLVLRRGDAGGARGLFQAGKVEEALRQVLALPGVGGVGLDERGLTIEWVGRRDAPRTLAALQTLAELGRRCERISVQVCVSERVQGKVVATPRFAWTDGGSQACCPYCKDAIDPTGADTTGCGRCGTVHHAACLEEAGGCTVFGCGAKAGRTPVT